MLKVQARKNIAILGSTGSIGINTLKVIKRYPDRFRVVGLTALNNVKLLETQIKIFSPSYAAVGEQGLAYLKKYIDAKKTKILEVNSGITRIASLKEVDVVVIGIRGSAALDPFLTAVRLGKTIAPANKEALVIAGDILMREAKKANAQIIPIDSEQSAIFQCLEGRNRSHLKKVYLTASGGPLLKIPAGRFDNLSREQILNHPRWDMGKKITVDSATLMNKGFEIMEARHLFDLNVDQIEVIIHPEAVIHSMVELMDGSVIAQLGVPDMRLPIQYALTYPERLESGLKEINFLGIKRLNFKKPDYDKFPCLRLAIDVAKRGGTLPSVLNAADEEAVEAFLNKKISFTKIFKIVERVLEKHKTKKDPSIPEILAGDQWAREESRRLIFN